VRPSSRPSATDDPARLAAAALLGTAAGMRSFTPAAALAVRGRLGDRPVVRVATAALALGELAGDKHPRTPSRTSPPALAGRIGSGAFVGLVAGGARGAAVGATASTAASFAFERLRGAIVARTPAPDPVVAVGEDALAIGTALAGAGLIPEERSLLARVRRLARI
jgi:uncharacterized membrane protein